MKSVNVIISLLFVSLIFPLKVSASIYTPNATPSHIISDVSTTVIINAYISDTNLISNSVRLYLTDDLGNPTLFVGYLNDEGINGDITAGDKIYSIQHDFLYNEEGIYNFIITGAISRSRNRLSSSFTIIVNSIPTIENTVQYNQVVNSIFHNFVAAQDCIYQIKNNSLNIEQLSENISAIHQNILIPYLSLKAIYDFESFNPSRFKISEAFTLEYKKLIELSDNYESEEKIFVNNGNDSRVQYILDWLVENNHIGYGDSEILEGDSGKADRASLYTIYINGNQNSLYHQILDESATVTVKKALQQAFTIAGDGISGIYQDTKIIVPIIKDAAIDFFIDIFKPKEAQALVVVAGQVEEGETIELPDGTHHFIFTYKDYEDRSIVYALETLEDSTDINLTPGQFDRKDGLIAYYPLNGTTYDESGYMYHGVQHGEINFVDGAIGQSVSFDGIDDYISVQDNDDLNLAGSDFTICAWINPGVSFNDQDVFLSKFSNSAVIESFQDVSGWYLGAAPGETDLYNNETGYLAYVMGNDLFTYNGNSTILDSYDLFYTNQWTHIAIRYSYDDLKLELFINGELNNVKYNVAPLLPEKISNLYIGAVPFPIQGSNAFHYSESLVDELYIFKRSVEQNEIKKIINNIYFDSRIDVLTELTETTATNLGLWDYISYLKNNILIHLIPIPVVDGIETSGETYDGWSQTIENETLACTFEASGINLNSDVQNNIILASVLVHEVTHYRDLIIASQSDTWMINVGDTEINAHANQYYFLMQAINDNLFTQEEYDQLNSIVRDALRACYEYKNDLGASRDDAINSLILKGYNADNLDTDVYMACDSTY